MENFCKGVTIGLVSGMLIGGVIVAKNRKLANKIKECVSVTEEKMQEVKDFIEEKIDESKCDCTSSSDCCGSTSQKYDFSQNSDNKDFNKKSKN